MSSEFVMFRWNCGIDKIYKYFCHLWRLRSRVNLCLPISVFLWFSSMTFWLLVLFSIFVDIAPPLQLFLSLLLNDNLTFLVLVFIPFLKSCLRCSGILIKTLADASNDHRYLSAPQIVLNVVGFCLTVSTTVVVTVYAKRRLNELQKEEQLLLKWASMLFLIGAHWWNWLA